MNLHTTVFFTSLVILTGCGGSSSGEIASSQPSDDSPVQDFGLGPTSPEVQALVDHIVIDEFVSTDGVIFEITQFSVDEDVLSGATVHMRVTNNSARSIEQASCTVEAHKDGERVDFTTPHFASQTILDPGESALGNDVFNNTPEKFSGFDRVWVRLCSWKPAIDRRIDIASDAVNVEFIEYSNYSSSPEVRLLLTNNSQDTIHSAICSVDAKIGNLIVDTAVSSFNRTDDIGPGEAFEGAGRFFGIDSLDNFEASPFDILNLNCRYSVSR